MTRVAVIGAGAVGLCCALHLAERGAKVTLYERGLPGGANSTLTGGGIRQQFGTAANIALSLLSAPFWEDFAARFGVDPLFDPIGYLFLAHDDPAARGLADTTALQNRMGVRSDYLDGAEVVRRWPALAGRGIVGAGFRQGDGWANQHRIVDGLVRGCLAAGVDLQVGVEVVALRTQAGRITGVTTTTGALETDAVVLATGPWMALLAPLGLSVPAVGHRHELLIVETAPPLPLGLPWLIGVRDQVHLRQDTPGRALIGGFLGHDDPADADAYAPRADAGWTRRVLETAGRVFGVIDPQAKVRHGWAGLYPSTPDRHPVIDRLAGGLYGALGFSGTGLMHAPAAGRLIANILLDGTTSAVDVAPYAAARFASPMTASERTGF